ncbi:MAG TPA: TIM barrel protein [Thermoanaerobaculia bacterium]|nr:TIM barrel protein [Thermoanaerobaculia bacterium]
MVLRTVNAFPFRAFHADVVKLDVYRPNWATDARRDYTLGLARLLAELLPDDVDEGSISTLPLGWRTEWSGEDAAAGRRALEEVADGLAELRDDTGKTIRLALEPEPGCTIETVAQAAAFLDGLAPGWIGLCLDACHLAVQFEDAETALAQLDAAGAHVVKAQVSSALRVPVPGSDAGRAFLEGFAEPRFLHQTRECVAGAVHGTDDLPEALDGYRIVQWSDVHVGPTIQRRFVASLVERTNALDADAIAITGDLVDSYVHEVGDAIAPLRDLRARDGVFYVTGNHEYYWRASEWIPELQRHGLQFLKNEHRIIKRGDAKLVMAGVTDPVGRYTHKQDPDRALAGAPRDAVKVLLSHRPQTAKDADRLGVHLQLSGHTHGGQFFPFNLFIRWFQPVVAGLHRIGRTWLYVSRGTGYWGPPSRLGVHGEITLIELTTSSSAARS